MQISEYPVILTDAHWQSNKGKIAKIAGETGIGALMKKCQAAHKQVDWTPKYQMSQRLYLQLGRFDPGMSKDQMVDLLEAESVKEFVKDAAPVRKLLAELRDQARKVAAEWKKKTLIPKSSVQHVEAVAAAADEFWLTMKENSSAYDTMVDVKKVRETLQKKKEEALKALNHAIQLCENGLQDVLKNPTKKQWGGKAHQGCRSVNNQIVAIPALKKDFGATWNKYGNNYEKDIPDDDPQEAAKIKAKIKTVAMDLIKFKAAAHKLLNG